MKIISPLDQMESTAPVRTNTTKAELLAYFKNSWNLYNSLFNSIKDDSSFYVAPDPLRHPLIFYWGHTAAFYINKLVMSRLLEKGLNLYYEELFAKGVDPNLPEELKKDFRWPEVDAVNDYRDQVYKIVESLIQRQADDLEINDQHPLWALLMGIEHDRIHFETSSVLLRQLSADLLECPEGWHYAPTNGLPPQNKLLQVKGGTVEIGKPKTSDIYGWDNEYGYLKKEVKPFAATKNLISNAEYLEFYHAGGYQDEQYWTEEGWAWKNRVDCQHPKFWVKTKDSFRYRAMFDELEMPLDWPVEVNAHEAWAYCHWKGEGYRLMSEAEFNLIAHQALEHKDSVFSDCYNLNMRYGSPNPVGLMQDGKYHQGFNDLFGNVWDWLSDDFYALTGYEIHYLYEDFSAPYFDKEHSMLAGAAWVTTGTAASKYYRLWFRRHFYQHAGFRLAKNIN